MEEGRSGAQKRRGVSDSQDTEPDELHPDQSKTDRTIGINDIETEYSENDSSCALCCICLNVYKEGEEVCWSKNTDCRHSFHRECVEQWLLKHDDCPYCRKQYIVPNNQDVELGNLPLTMEDSNSQGSARQDP